MVVPIKEIEKVIAGYGAAAEGNLRAPGREGSLVVLTPQLADEVMITGDLHGNRPNFEAVQGLADLGAHPMRHLVLQEVCHGGPTYASNGGCMSHTMLEDVARLVTQYPGRVHFILGNHELAELTDYPIQKNRQMLNLLFRLGLKEAYGSDADRVREAYSPFLRSCPLGVFLPGGIFVTHSIPEKVDSLPFDTSIFTRSLEPGEFHQRDGVFDLVWGRDSRRENAVAFAQQVGAKILINGHDPCPEGFNAPNDIQIVLDSCGAKACYVNLATDQEWTHARIVERIGRLE